MSQGMASEEEKKANQTVQDLKPLVDEADTCNPEELTGTKLSALMTAVDRSIRARERQKNLPKDGGGHAIRTDKERGILKKLRDEMSRRAAAKSNETDAKNVKAMTGLPATSTWGGPKK
jgi:hypothetical protein